MVKSSGGALLLKYVGIIFHPDRFFFTDGESGGEAAAGADGVNDLSYLFQEGE